jgi:hypothetical protein
MLDPSHPEAVWSSTPMPARFALSCSRRPERKHDRSRPARDGDEHSNAGVCEEV